MIHLPLRLFLEVVQGFEATAREESCFWKAHDVLSNYLANTIRDSHTSTLSKFLSCWRSARPPIDWKDLACVWTPEMQRISSLCGSLKLESCDFARTLTLSGHRLTLGQAVKILYDRLLMVTGIGATKASKLLAVAMPSLFVMRDAENIRSLYTLSTTPHGYLQFLTDMQQYGKKLISEVCASQKARKWKRPLGCRTYRSIQGGILMFHDLNPLRSYSTSATTGFHSG